VPPHATHQLTKNEVKIAEELLAAQGEAVDIGCYYSPDFNKAMAVMRPSTTFNAVNSQGRGVLSD
jgi:isocitrate dehydrogenase